MSQSLLRHEKESKELAEKLVIMKNQIMESNIYGNIKVKKFPGFKFGRMKIAKKTPVFVIIKYYLIIYS
jgi:hypothetical protein